MPFYESIFIIRQSLNEEEAGEVIDKIKGSLEKHGAILLKANNWGKKKMAYEVQHDRRGTFVHLQFEASGQVITQLERSYRLEDSILKFLTIRLNEKDIQPVTAVDEEDLQPVATVEATVEEKVVQPVATEEVELDRGGIQ